VLYGKITVKPLFKWTR